MIVVDTSAVVHALAADPADPALLERLGADADLHAPHLIDVEALQALRRLVAAGELSPERAEDARAEYLELSIARYPHLALLERMWQLRENLTAYDAAFVALAEALEAPLVTCDARIAAAPGHQAGVETYAPAD